MINLIKANIKNVKADSTIVSKMHVSIFSLPIFNSLFPIPFRGDSFAPDSVSTVDSDDSVSTPGIVPMLSSAKL